MRKEMSIDARKQLVVALKQEYLNARRAEKTALLEVFLKSTGYCRKYAIKLLSDRRIRRPGLAKPRSRTAKYDVETIGILIKIWLVSNRICAKRLHPMLKELVVSLERHGHIKASKRCKDLLFQMSPSTMDRLLKPERKKYNKGRSTTKPGALLKRHIKVRTFNDPKEVVPGFFEADTVAHCGGSVTGSFLYTFTLIDIHTGWIELRGLSGKTESAVTAALSSLLKTLPFPFKGFDTDNGSEFINSTVTEWCKNENVLFTRSRAYKKNDQAHVEERNGSVVRKFVGYDRFEGHSSLLFLNQLLEKVRQYVNFFQPSMQLCKKERDGGKVTKHYDIAQTPYQRLRKTKLSRPVRASLRTEYLSLDPLKLLQEISDHQVKLWRTAVAIDASKIAGTSLFKLFRDEPTDSTPEDLLSKIDSHRQSLRKRRKKPKIDQPTKKFAELTSPTQDFRQYIKKLGPGATFGRRELLHLGHGPSSVDVFLNRMLSKKELIKIRHGKYKVPIIAPLIPIQSKPNKQKKELIE